MRQVLECITNSLHNHDLMNPKYDLFMFTCTLATEMSAVVELGLDRYSREMF